MSDERRILQCGDRDRHAPALGSRCEQRWGALIPTRNETIRYCELCDHNVYRVVNAYEARVRARKGQCLAVPEAVFDEVHARVDRLRPSGGIYIGGFDEGAFIDQVIPVDPLAGEE